MNNENDAFFMNDVEAENLILEEKQPQTSEVLYEDISKRSENIKHFRMKDGSHMAAVYERPVHIFDQKSGRFIDVPHKFEEQEDSFAAETAHFEVRFPKKKGERKYVAVEKDGRCMRWRYLSQSSSHRKQAVAAVTLHQRANVMDLPRFPRLQYEKTESSVDLEYGITDNGVKGNIILHKRPKRTVFRFDLQLTGLEAVLSDDGKSVYVFDAENKEGEPFFVIPPANMTDAAGAYSEETHYALTKTEKDLVLELIADPKWLLAEERIYPVTVDPQVTVPDPQHTATLTMASVCSDGSTVSSGNYRRVGIDEHGNIHRLFIKPTLPNIPGTFKITKASLVLHNHTCKVGSEDARYMVYAVDPSGAVWSGNTITWSNAPDVLKTNSLEDFQGITQRNNEPIALDITRIAEQWYTSNLQNNGIVIMAPDAEESAKDICDGCGEEKAQYFDLYSNTSAETQNRAALYITYMSDDTYADHQKYETFENGRAGTGSINLFTGHLSFAHGDVSAEGVRLPLAVSHVYRSVNLNDTSFPYGRGWRLSVAQTLEIVDRSDVMAIYTNAQGKRHAFVENEDRSITDDAGLGLTLHKCECDGEGNQCYCISDLKGNQLCFNASGKLYKMKDASGVVSTLTYESGRLVKVVDGNRNTATLTYNGNGQLVKIVDGAGGQNNANRAITYSYTGERLTAIRYPSLSDESEELTTRFTYDDITGFLISVTDQTGIRYVIEYTDDGKVRRIRQQGTLAVTEAGATTLSAAENGGGISFEYFARSTAVKDDQTGIKTVYCFDENGREVCSYEDLTELADTSLRSESTRAKISGYRNYLSSAELIRNTGKYRNVSVEIAGSASAMPNLLQNGCFTQYDYENNVPVGWVAQYADPDTDGGSAQTYLPGKRSYMFGPTNKSDTKALVTNFDINLSELNGNVLVASAWAKLGTTSSAPAEGAVRIFRLYATVYYDNGRLAEYYENFDSSRADWQYVAIPIVLDPNDPPHRVRYELQVSDNQVPCYFANARLVAAYGVATTNEYNIQNAVADKTVFGESKQISTVNTTFDGILTTVNYQDSEFDTVMTEVTDLDGHTFTSYYQYDSKHNLIKAEDYRGMVTEYTYDPDYGKQIKQITYHKSDPALYMFSQNTYEDGHFLVSERDPRFEVDGKKLKVQYEYDKQRGIMTKRTDTNGQEYNYSYDANTDDLRTLSTAVNEISHENRFFYKQGYLTKVEHNGFHFGFSYDALGRSTKVCVGDNTSCVPLISTEYEDGVTDKVTTTYATGEKTQVITDIRGNPVKKTYTSADHVTKTISTATYDEVGSPLKLVDKVKGVCYDYTYNSDGNVIRVEEKSASCGCTIAVNTTAYDKHKRVTEQVYGATGQTYRTIYQKDSRGYTCPDGEVDGVRLDEHFADIITRDGLGRTQKHLLNVPAYPEEHALFAESFQYLTTPVGSRQIATSFVSGITREVHGAAHATKLLYTYNDAGGIETVSLQENINSADSTILLFKYYYDGLNRLVREDNYPNNKTYVWVYNVGGNITEKRTYALTADIHLGSSYTSAAYGYASSGWRDRLTSYNNQPCSYDSMGNPTVYRGNSLTWTLLRQLAAYGSNTFAYGADGVRYRKNSTTYTVHDNKILRETNDSRTLTYYYGGSGVVGFQYNGMDYFYQKNLQGDITAIYDQLGTLVAEYLYDAWGKVLRVTNHTSAGIGNINPFRYRGYYYDTETGLYYLNTRYYDPETGRFISSDTTEVLDNAKDDIGGLNLYAYCDNNPVSGRDDDGTMSFWKKLAVAAAAVVAVAVVAAAVAAATAATGGAAGAALCAVTSTFVGAAQGAVIGAVSGAITGAVTGAVMGAVEGYMEDGWDGVLAGAGRGAWKGAVQGAQDGMISGMVMGGVSGAMNPSFCFVAGTAVLTTLGKKAIETVQVGDTIPCVDHITGEQAVKRVVSTSVNKVDKLVELEIGGEVIRCTDTHPFQVKDKGWVKAEKLQPGDLVYNKDWNTTPVQRVDILHLAEPVEVYNFEVEDCHTYYVGNGSWLVHNLCVKQMDTSGTGQNHHPFSRKIIRQSNKNPLLRGEVTRNSGTIRALDKVSHNGYQKWHRNFDRAVTTWLKNHSNATASEFATFMNKLYGSEAALSRFGPVIFG